MCDFELAWEVFGQIEAMWGRFTIDRAATARTCKVYRQGRPVFNSRFSCRFSCGSDFRCQFDWADHFNYVNAPFHLIPSVLHCIFEQQANAVVIVPHDTTALWWPYVQHGSPGVRDIWTLPMKTGVVARGGQPCHPMLLRAVLFVMSDRVPDRRVCALVCP